jgi:hypothetical protein
VPYPLWRDVLAELPGVTFRSVDQSFLFAAICQSQEELAVVGYCAAAGEAMAQAMLAASPTGCGKMATAAARTTSSPSTACRRWPSTSPASS